MPSGVYRRTEFHSQRLSEGRKRAWDRAEQERREAIKARITAGTRRAWAKMTLAERVEIDKNRDEGQRLAKQRRSEPEK